MELIQNQTLFLFCIIVSVRKEVVIGGGIQNKSVIINVL